MIVRAGNGKLGLSGSQGMSNLVYARMLASWSCCQYESLTVLTQNAGQAGNMRYLWPARGEDIGDTNAVLESCQHVSLFSTFQRRQNASAEERRET